MSNLEPEPGEIIENNNLNKSAVSLKSDDSDNESNFFLKKKLNRSELIEENNEKKQNILCKHFLRGNCLNGDKCNFSHSKKNIPCKFYHGIGNCTKKNCEFSHKELTDEGKKKFIIQHESFLVSAKNKFGKTKVDKLLNEYVNEKKKINVNNNNQNVNNNLGIYIPIYYPYLILYDDQNVNTQNQIPFINLPIVNQFKIGQQN